MAEWHPTQEQIEAVARAMEPELWAAIDTFGDIAAMNVRIRSLSKARVAISVLAPIAAEECARIAQLYADAAEADIAGNVPVAVSSMLLRDICIAGDIGRDIRSRFNLPAKT